MPVGPSGYPALVERALRLIEARGEPVDGAELAKELFGAAQGPWAKLVAQVVGRDGRLRALPDGRYALCRGERSEGPSPREAASAADPSSGSAYAPTTTPPAGLVVFGAGPKPWRDPIVAIGAARWVGERLEQAEWMVRPALPCRVPAYLGKYGVDAAAVEDGMPLARAVEALLAFVGEAPLAGLDVALAAARLQYALRELGRDQLANQLVELAVPEGERPDLLRLARRAGLPVPERPRPANLAALAARLARPELGAIRESKGGYRTDSALGATAWRRLLDARLLAAVPESSGIYLFRDAAGRLLYVGKATSLRARLSSYLRGNFPLIRQMPGLVEATEDLTWESLPCELAARLREAELIAAHEPPYNVQRRVGPRLVWASLALDGEPIFQGRVARLVLDGGRPHPGPLPEGEETLTSASAANAALADARRGWWPPRPRAAERPSEQAVRARFADLAARFTEAAANAELPGALRARDLAGGLLVVAPRRPPRLPTDDAAADASDDGWTRERVDPEWPPRDLFPLPLGEGEGEGVPARPDAEPEPDTNQLAALRVDPTGLRAAALFDPPDDDAHLQAAALAALADEPERPATTKDAGLAALSVLLAAIARHEPGLRVWPLDRIEG